ncbi:MBL fold metallo-hydrolase [Lachnospiraceae bacterium HCP1S3_C3]|nr:MBL fold metallo-hydrolase [Lachnospiraceae bacterium]MDD6857074.1 MBL fold metallo-hydrolase [Lachnospiraceae bacterium]
MSLVVKNMVLGMIMTNCYIAYDDVVKEAFIVDPADSADEIQLKITELGVKPVAILLTHGHFDHIGAVDELRDKYKIKVYVYEDEKDVMTSDANLASMIGKRMSVEADEYLRDLQTIIIGGEKIQVIHTPGHTKGSCCFYLPDEKVLFSGDTMFCQSFGRTDFPTGSMSQLISSIKNRLLKLDDDVKVYPGHNEETKIGFERHMYDNY